MIVLYLLGAAALLAAAAAIGYAVVIYNGLVRLRNECDKAWSNIDVLLKQRHDEIPKLVDVCRGYMNHEHETLEAVVRARAAAGAPRRAEHFDAQTAVTTALRSLFAVVENYPNLKADESFRRLQGRISELEDLIADRREFFNEAVNLYNTRIQQFPDVLVARQFRYQPRRLWRAAPDDRRVPVVAYSAGA